MAGYLSGDTRKVTTHRLIEMKQRGEKISMLTSYDYTMAQIVDGAGIDVILVGDFVDVPEDGNTNYYRDENDVHYVPKRTLADELLN